MTSPGLVEDPRFPGVLIQIAFATSLAKRKGYKYLADAEKACFGKCKIGGLNREGISQLIEWLSK